MRRNSPLQSCIWHKKDLSFEDELEKAAEALYGKYVPAGVREFIELNAESKAAAKPKKTSPGSFFCCGRAVCNRR